MTILYSLDYSYSCSISDRETTTITGGRNTTDDGDRVPVNKVSQYNVTGWIQDLPQLQQSRWDHGCGYYFNNDIKVYQGI